MVPVVRTLIFFDVSRNGAERLCLLRAAPPHQGGSDRVQWRLPKGKRFSISSLKELIDKYDKDCLVLTHSGKPTANDSGDPFDKIIGSTALQGVPDNLIVLAQSNGQTKIHTKGSLKFASEKILNFKNGKYTERSGVGAECQNKAPAKAEVLKRLETKKMTVSELVHTLGKDKGQISNICAKFSEYGQIKRDNRTSPWEYVWRTPEH
jgi:hypothetical protein